MRRMIVVASRQTEYEIRRDMFAHLQTLDKHVLRPRQAPAT